MWASMMTKGFGYMKMLKGVAPHVQGFGRAAWGGGRQMRTAGRLFQKGGQAYGRGRMGRARGYYGQAAREAGQFFTGAGFKGGMRAGIAATRIGVPAVGAYATADFLNPWGLGWGD